MNGEEIRTSNDEGSVVYGLFLCWGTNILQIVVGCATLGMGGENFASAFVVIGGIGLIQLVYVLPMYFQFRKQGKSDTAKGMVIAASITALLNATCWGMFASR